MIKVGYLVSYDYKFLLTSIRQLYIYVDRIFIAVDINRKTWSGNNFKIPSSFFEEIASFDSSNKIEFYFDNFYIPDLEPIECETRERNMLLKKMGKGWLMQLDVDEYIYDFKSVAKYLKKYWYLTIFPTLTPIVFKGKLLTLYRELEDGYVYVDNNEYFSFITNQSNFVHTRNNNVVRNHFTNIAVIHQSWARSEDEIQMKISNWGHRDDFDTLKYFEFWKNIFGSNYMQHKNVHPIVPEVWGELRFLQSTSIDDFINKYAAVTPQEIILIDKWLMIRALFNKIFK
jgi:hypothetical protein